MIHYLAAASTVTNPFSWPTAFLLGIIVGAFGMAWIKR